MSRALALCCLGAVTVLLAGRLADADETGIIRGFIETEDGRPITEADVSAELGDGDDGVPRVARTDTKGRFSLANLPDGTYYLRASKKECCSEMEFGATTAGFGGAPVVLASGNAVDVRIVLPRSGSISGAISGPDGSLLAGASLSVLRPRLTARGTASPDAVTSVRSDERGAYRIGGLPPGTYWLRVEPSQTGSRDGMAYMPTYYPSSLTQTTAATLELHAGERKEDVNIAVALVPVARALGTIIDIDNSRVIALEVTRINADNTTSRLRLGAELDGRRFAVRDLTPGEYLLRAQYTRADSPDVQHSSHIRFSITGGGDVAGLTLVLRPDIAVTGRVRFGGTSPAPPPSTIRVWLIPEAGAGVIASALVRDDATFAINDVVPGTYRFSVQFSSASRRERLHRGPWAVEAILVDGNQAADQAISIAGDVAISVVLTDRFGKIEGRVLDRDRRAERGTIVAYPVDPAAWTAPSRWVAAVRPAYPSGAWSIPGLPQGTYRLVLLDNATPHVWLERGFFARVDSSAVTVGLRDGETTVHDIAIRSARNRVTGAASALPFIAIYHESRFRGR